MRTFLLYILTLTSAGLLAQETNNLTYVKVFVNGSYLKSTYLVLDSTPNSEISASLEKNNFDFGYISLVIGFSNKKRLSHEFELMPIRIRLDDEKMIFHNSQFPGVDIISGDGKTTFIETAIRHQLNINLNKDKRWKPMISSATQFYYNYSGFTPVTSVPFPTSNHKFGLLLSIVPGLIRELSDKFAIEINIPLHFYEISLDSFNNYDPTLSVDKRNKKKITGQFLPHRFSIRFGAIYKLNY